MMTEPRPQNRLGNETSPYLLQHAHNPVNWYPWGEEALGLARREDRPILLSIGYAACHWCHVMERESFENDDIAAAMNEGFVCIKVDREERPDLDDIYMTAVQLMTGSGGWPLTVFLTPELKPFFGGTYFPPQDRAGMPGFPRVLQAVRQSFDNQRQAIEEASSNIVTHIEAAALRGGGSRDDELAGEELLRAATEAFRRRFEPVFGGFSRAPKFPHPMAISLLLRCAARHEDADALQMVTVTLDRMAYGGLYDQLGGGFHRYSTDDRWLVPHFEKMLYDNALLAIAYLEAVQLTGHEEYRRIATETLDWVLREMQDANGGYYSTLDADSEGIEGKFYVWRREEIDALLGRDALAFCTVYDVTPSGNWEGANILNLAKPALEFHEDLDMEPEQLEELLTGARARLLAVRSERTWPDLDDKVLTDWNGLMVAAMARGYRVLGDERFLESARRAATFLCEHMFVDGRLLHSYRAGRARLLGHLDDYAYLTWGLVELFEASFELRWLRQARALARDMIELFWDGRRAGFFFTGSDHERLIARMKPSHDGATPSGNAVAANVLLRLHTLTGEERYERTADELLRSFGGEMERAPSGHAHMLAAVDYQLSAAREIALLGATDHPLVDQALRALWRRFRPRDLIVAVDPDAEEAQQLVAEVPLLKGKVVRDGKPTFYACANYVCDAPTHDLDDLVRQAGTR